MDTNKVLCNSSQTGKWAHQYQSTRQRFSSQETRRPSAHASPHHDYVFSPYSSFHEKVVHDGFGVLSYRFCRWLAIYNYRYLVSLIDSISRILDQNDIDSQLVLERQYKVIGVFPFLSKLRITYLRPWHENKGYSG